MIGWLFGRKRIASLERALADVLDENWNLDIKNRHLQRKLEMAGEQIQELAEARDGFVTLLRGRKAKLKELGVDVKKLDAETVADKEAGKINKVVPIFDTAGGAIRFAGDEIEDAAEDALHTSFKQRD